MPVIRNFKVFSYVAAALLVTLVIFGISLLPAGSREISTLENIDGVPFPHVDEIQQISEQLAHADLYLNQPGLAKELQLNISFVPHDLEALYVGVRDSAFWLSYEPIQIYSRSDNSTEPRDVAVSIPLTDKLQDRDQSLDVMFFAVPVTTPGVVTDSEISIPAIEAWLPDRVNDETYWELHGLSAEVKTKWPTGTDGAWQVGDWLFSILRRERPL